MENGHINYVELRAKDLEKIKQFYTSCFGWKFTDYGTTYTAFSHSGLDGGFEQSEKTPLKGILLVLYHKDLMSIKEKIVAEGGKIVKDIFSFPGGKRFHFLDLAGNELAIWSEN